MGYIVRMPQMGMEMEQGEVVSWEYDEGESVTADETLVVVESEKATNEVEAREDGVLRHVVEEGGTVEPGTPVGIVAGPDEDISDYEAEIDAESAADTAETDSASAGAAATSGGGSTDGASAQAVRATPGARQHAEREGVDLSAVEGTGPQGVITEKDVTSHAAGAGDGDSTGAAASGGGSTDGASAQAVRATPGARQRAGQEGVDLSAVEGTGPQGVITEDDVEAALEAAAGTDAGGAGAATRTVSEAREHSGMQRTVGDRLGESYRNAVHVTVKRSFDASTLRAVAAAADAAGVEVSLTDLLVTAVGNQLDAQPAFNALFEDGEHRLIEEVNVGVAVDVDEGLVTPVVPEVTEKSVEELASVRSRLTDRALSGEFTSDDLAGGTFTVSNLGMFGVDSFDPVINPPETAILGVGRVRDDGTMTLSLSFDHRVVNGADAARFLDGLVDRLTDPVAMFDAFEADLHRHEDVTVSVDA